MRKQICYSIDWINNIVIIINSVVVSIISTGILI